MIYPALKELKKKGMIKVDYNEYYSLNPQDEAGLEYGCVFFYKISII